MEEVILNTIEDKWNANLICGIIEDQLQEQGIDIDTFAFEIKVFYNKEQA